MDVGLIIRPRKNVAIGSRFAVPSNGQNGSQTRSRRLRQVPQPPGAGITGDGLLLRCPSQTSPHGLLELIMRPPEPLLLLDASESTVLEQLATKVGTEREGEVVCEGQAGVRASLRPSRQCCRALDQRNRLCMSSSAIERTLGSTPRRSFRNAFSSAGADSPRPGLS